MFITYDKNGKEVLFQHAIDAKEAVKIGVCFTNPPSKGPQKEAEKLANPDTKEPLIPDTNKTTKPTRGPKAKK